MTEPLCPACSLGPSGIAGHPTLWVQTVGGAPSFKCGGCRTLWMRTATNGIYAWENITEEASRAIAAGVFVPPRTQPHNDDTPLPALARYRLPT